MKSFIDSNVYISILNEEESTHIQSLELLNTLKSQKSELFTSNYIISECLTVLSKKFNHKTAVVFENDIYSGNTKILMPTREIEDIARTIFRKEINKDISYIDCTNIAFCIRYKLDQLITFDKELIKLFNKAVQ
ncbi:PIN domain-containing protein [Patescibacteria group bacterium]|nr:PIN domain-containing protein [Patescibacteria group bacterium]